MPYTIALNWSGSAGRILSQPKNEGIFYSWQTTHCTVLMHLRTKMMTINDSRIWLCFCHKSCSICKFEDSRYLILVGVWCFRPEYQDRIRKPAQQWQSWSKLTISVQNLIPFQLSASLKKYPQAKVQNSFVTIDIRKEAKENLTKDICMNLDISWDNCSKIGQLITEGLNTLEG